MRSTFKRTAAVLAVILVTATLFSVAAPSAIALTYSGTSSYESGPYYEKLCAVELTGNQREDIMKVARSQIGYHESNSASDLAGTTNGSNNCTEYADWYNDDLQWNPWCAMFVSWCAYAAGVPESIIYKHAYTPYGLEWFQNRNQAYSRKTVADGGYVPESGDIVYFNDSSTTASHIGFVSGYSNGILYTIEGNASDAVVERSYSITNTYIVYICRPAYENSEQHIITHIDEVTGVQGGVYIRGWCFDQSDKDRELRIDVYFGEIGSYDVEGHTGIYANLERSDIDEKYGCGKNHGFEATVTTQRDGQTRVSVFAVNGTSEVSALAYAGEVEIESCFAFVLDEYSGTNGGIKIRGWCYDKRDPEIALELEAHIGGWPGWEGTELYDGIIANTYRDDVDRVFHCGTNHGFIATIPTQKRGEEVTAIIYAVNPTNGEKKIIGFFAVPVTDNGIAYDIKSSFDVADPSEGAVYLEGWAFDDIDPTVSLTIEVYIGGDDQAKNAEKHIITADKERTDVNNVFGCGDNHGFEKTINTKKSGEQDIYVYAIAANGTDKMLLGTKQADIPAAQTAVLVGDINNDGKINNKDVVALFRYVSSASTGADMSVYDVNNDGKINNKDVVALFRLTLTK